MTETVDGLDFDETSLPDPLRTLAFLDIDSGSNEEGLTDSLAQAAMEAQIQLRNRSL